jgi:SlyX protein
MKVEALEQIESKIAFLERANIELSDVVFRQQQEIQALRAKITALADRMAAAQSDEDVRSAQDERPPHY